MKRLTSIYWSRFKIKIKTVTGNTKKGIMLIGLTIILYGEAFSQLFPNPVTLATGQGAPGTTDPLWLASPWYTNLPPNPMGLTYASTLINNNCAPGSWVDPTALAPPMNNGNWITGNESNCAANITSGYRYFRLTLNLPADCNGYSVAVAGNYVLDLIGYVDNQITDVFINGNSTGISGGSFTVGNPLSIHLIGPWVAGINYVDILVYNSPNPNPNDVNPYGLLLVADATSAAGNDTDNDGVSDLDDQCPCEPGNNPYGCIDPVFNTCDVVAIRAAFLSAGCIELNGCVNECSIYFLNPTSNTGSGAQAFAQTLGANLISIQSAAENQCILDELIRLNHSGVIWIGFNDETTEGTFVWYDQSPVTYTNWAPGEPNQTGDEDCVQIYPGGASPGTWNDLSCTSGNAKSIIEVNLCPVIDAGNDKTICLGENVDLQATNTILGSFPYTYLWSNGAHTTTTNVSPTQTTEYGIVTTDRYNCTGKDSVTVIVNPLPNVIAGTDTSLCQGASIILNAYGAATYQWDNNVSNGVPFTPLTSGTYTITGTSTEGCVGTDQINITIIPFPIIAMIPSTEKGCIPLTVDFINNTTGADNYLWNFENGTYSTLPSPSHVYDQVGCFDVTLTASTIEGCSIIETFTNIICTELPPIASFFANPYEVSPAIPFTQLINTSQNAISYSWDFGDGSSQSTAISPTHIFPEDNIHNYTITLIASSSMGCKDTAMSIIKIKDDAVFFIPNTFTPNGDQHNQVFKPVFVTGFDAFNYEMKIYNRWGEIIFESHDVDGGWDGTYLFRADQIAPDGTYPWKITFKTSLTDEKITRSGHVTLIR